jgi:molybdopterin converting factor small subunit
MNSRSSGVPSRDFNIVTTDLRENGSASNREDSPIFMMNGPHNIRVEFYGMPRQWAGRSELEVPARTLGDVFEQVAARLPVLAEHCFSDGTLQAGYLTNINGQIFTRDPRTPLAPNDAVLLLSADAGG